MQQFDVFGKFLENLEGNDTDGHHFLGKFKLFNVDSGKGLFLSVFQTPFYGYFQTLNRKAFILVITLFGANTPEPSKICQKVEALPY